MPTLTIRNISERLYRALEESAKVHGRSLNGEVLACLEESLGATPVDVDSLLSGIQELRDQISAPRLTDRILRSARERGRP